MSDPAMSRSAPDDYTPGRSAKKARVSDRALESMPQGKVEAVVRALGRELDPPQAQTPTAYELRDGPKFAINDSTTGKAKTYVFPPGPVTMFVSENGTIQVIFQCEVADAEHPHYDVLKAIFEELGGGNRDDFQIGRLWKEISLVKAMFPKNAPNLKQLHKLPAEKRLEAMSSDFAQSHVNLDGSAEGMKSKMTIMPSTVAIKRQKNEGPPMFTLTCTYRPIAREGDRSGTEGVKLTPRLEAYLAANPAAAVDMRMTPFTTTMATKLDTATLLGLPWVVTPSCEFLKVYMSATVATPAVVPSLQYGRFTTSAYINRARIYGCVGSDAPDEPEIDEDKVNSVYASLYA